MTNAKKQAINENITLEDLGYDPFFESSRKTSGLLDYSIARVIAEYKEAYKVKGITCEYLAKITGKHRFNATRREDYPAVGDWVTITELDRKKAIIHDILPRKTILRKKYSGEQKTQIIATNIDVAFIIESVDRDYNLNRFERYLVLVNDGNIRPVIILNKIDLITESELKLKIDQIKDRFNDVDIIATSTLTEQGLDELVNYILNGKTYCFIGSSGVGKSSLINKLLGKDVIKIKEISDHSGRGKHATTSREMYFLKEGGILIDNPGMRGVGMIDASAGINTVFEEIMDLSKKCKYADCTHTHEPGCAVLKAIQTKELDEKKYANYLKLKKETEYYSMTKLEKRKKDEKFGKFIKKAKKQLKKQYD
ncbi:ribosome small subunit-dependent GTPase A [Candidatus Undinarchaeota archaeon]